jgi:hypothetical protein
MRRLRSPARERAEREPAEPKATRAEEMTAGEGVQAVGERISHGL